MTEKTATATTTEDRKALAATIREAYNRAVDGRRLSTIWLDVADAVLTWFAARQPAPTVSAEIVERAARALWECWNPVAPPWGAAREQDRDEARAQARAVLAAAAPTVAEVMDALHPHPVEVAPYFGVWECTCGAPIRGMREQAEQVAALWGAR